MKPKPIFLSLLLITIAAVFSTGFARPDPVDPSRGRSQSTQARRRTLFIPLVSDLAVPCVPSRVVRESALVASVVDGDDIEVFMNGVRVEVHFLGADTPDSPDKVFLAESTMKAQELVGGRRVTLIRDGANKDEYGRLRRYVFVGNTFVNLELIAQGYAWPDELPRDYACREDFYLAQQSAQERSLGMWGVMP